MQRFSSVCRAMLVAGLVIPVGAACRSSSTGPGSSLTGCSGSLAVDVTFDPTRAPNFSWRPTCGISDLAVYQSDSAVWGVTVPGDRLLSPGVRYGTTPPHATVWTAAQSLQPGVTYRVQISYLVGGDVLGAQADTTFTVPFPLD
ncbi:MAG TPA: hypothetical protein VFJ96_10395 [Gemmatimonadaceae bacterium]|nr:hypothetical protein [Gemmatimonadaceae bacterium]